MSDEVDEVIAAWNRARPDLDCAPVGTWSRIRRLAATMESGRSAAFARHGLQGWEFDVLAALRRAGDPFLLSPGQLIKETHVTSGTMTNRVDRLADRGLVAREAHPGDGRGVLVRLTDAGKAAVEAAFADLLDVERAMTTALSEAEQLRLAELLSTLLVAQRERS